MTATNETHDLKADLQPMDAGGGYGSDLMSSPTAKMDMLRRQLSESGHVSEGMSWKLLMLEWKYDISVLFGSVGHWIRVLDTQFNRFDSRH